MVNDPVLGPRLRALRRQLGATLAELSEVTRISVSTLSRASPSAPGVPNPRRAPTA